MIYGLYLSAQGAQVQSLRQDTIANNLANASTNSFKRDFVRAQSHSPFQSDGASRSLSNPMGGMHGGVTASGITTDFAQGALSDTSNPFDIGLQGKGFLEVTDGKTTYLTRDGQLTLSDSGELVTRNHGLSVRDINGRPIFGLDPKKELTVLQDGTLLQDKASVGQINLVEPAHPEDLQKVAKNRYLTTGQVGPSNDTVVKQGYIELSGTQPVIEMMDLIEASRAFEANINMIKNQDDALGKLLGSLPRA